jgi:hypothetical protein
MLFGLARLIITPDYPLATREPRELLIEEASLDFFPMLSKYDRYEYSEVVSSASLVVVGFSSIFSSSMIGEAGLAEG